MKWLKVSGVIFGAMIITALGIDAADTLSGNQGTLLGQLAGSQGNGCPAGMIALSAPTTFRCVDKFEASPGEACPVKNPDNQFDTGRNLDVTDCAAASAGEVTPWRFINREEAQLACQRAGKRLPNNEEWHTLALGTPDSAESCNITTSAVKSAGAHEACISTVGAFDSVGNVWEWTHDDVFDGQYNGRTLPAEGYVGQTDKGGVATLTGSSSSETFGDDYFWSEESGAFAILRGGFYGSKSDAGVYATHAATVPTMIGTAIGFRCVM